MTLAVRPRAPASADRPAVHAATAALAAPYEVEAYSAPIEPTLMIEPPARSLPSTAVVVSTALSRLASRFARQAAATRSSSATAPPGSAAGAVKSVLPP